jgi:heat shock protein HspQ
MKNNHGFSLDAAALWANIPIMQKRHPSESIMKIVESRFGLGAIVRHRIYDFRGVVFDVDPEFGNSDEWYQSIPADRRPRRNQPYYHLYAENPESYYVAYVSEQNLVEDSENGPVGHPQIGASFSGPEDGRYISKHMVA